MSASLIRSRAMVTHAIDRHRWNEITDGAVLRRARHPQGPRENNKAAPDASRGDGMIITNRAEPRRPLRRPYPSQATDRGSKPCPLSGTGSSNPSPSSGESSANLLLLTMWGARSLGRAYPTAA